MLMFSDYSIALIQFIYCLALCYICRYSEMAHNMLMYLVMVMHVTSKNCVKISIGNLKKKAGVSYILFDVSHWFS